MQNIPIILLIASVLLCSCDKDEITDTQSGQFVKFYTNFPEFTAADVATTDEGYAVLGTAKTLEGETWICLLRTDPFGNTTDSARLYGVAGPGGASNTAYCIKHISDGGFGILGSIINPASGKRSAYFVKTDHQGNTEWTRTISGINDLEAKYFDEGGNGSFYMTGYYDSTGKGKQIWWFGITSQGENIRNQRSLGFDAADEGTHLSILSDGRLIITGYITDTESSLTKSIIIKTDRNTVFVTRYIIDPGESGINESGRCLLPLTDDEYLLLGTSQNASASQMTLREIVFASQPETQWTKTYDSQSSESARSLISDGQSFYILGTSIISSSGTAITLTKTDLLGNQTDRTMLGSGTRLTASDFEQTTDGGFIIAGTNVHPEVNNTSLALIKVR